MKTEKSDIFYTCFIGFMFVLYVISMYEAMVNRPAHLEAINAQYLENAKAAVDYEDKSLEQTYDNLIAELNEHPENGYAHLFIATLWYAVRDYDEASASVDKALEYLLPADHEFRASAYLMKSGIALIKEDKESGIGFLKKALKETPDDESLQQRLDDLMEKHSDFK